MRSNSVPVAVTPRAVTQVRPVPAGPRNAIDRLRYREHLESIVLLRSAVRALGEVDVSGWDDAALTDHLGELSAALCAVDAQLTRVADAVRARGFRIAEPLAA
jgi:hypothetical protein